MKLREKPIAIAINMSVCSQSPTNTTQETSIPPPPEADKVLLVLVWLNFVLMHIIAILSYLLDRDSDGLRLVLFNMVSMSVHLQTCTEAIVNGQRYYMRIFHAGFMGVNLTMGLYSCKIAACNKWLD